MSDLARAARVQLQETLAPLLGTLDEAVRAAVRHADGIDPSPSVALARHCALAGVEILRSDPSRVFDAHFLFEFAAAAGGRLHGLVHERYRALAEQSLQHAARRLGLTATALRQSEDRWVGRYDPSIHAERRGNELWVTVPGQRPLILQRRYGPLDG